MSAGTNKRNDALPPDDESIQAPARLTELHVQERETSKVAGAPRAWSKLTPIELAYRQGRLGDLDSKDARSRLGAGCQYADLWARAQKAGRDCTAGFDVGRVMGSGVPLTEAQSAALARLVRVEMHLGPKDRMVIRAVCAWGHSPVEAMAMAKMPTDTRVSARLCESMDALADALDRTAKSRRR